MALGELLEADLARWAKRVGTNDRLPTDERAEIDARELLGASWAKRRVRDVAGRTLDGTDPAGPGQSADPGTTERWTASSWMANPEGSSSPPGRCRFRSHETARASAALDPGGSLGPGGARGAVRPEHGGLHPSGFRRHR